MQLKLIFNLNGNFMKSKGTALTAALLCFAIFTNAQTIERGSKLISGSLSMSSTSSNNLSNPSYYYKGNSGNIFLSAGTAVKDNLFAGVSLGFGRSKQTSENETATKATSNAGSYSANVFLRAYKNIGKDLYVFVQPVAGFSFHENKYEREPTSTYTKSSSIYASVGPGMSYRLFNAFYLDLALPNVLYLGYTKAKDANSKSNSFDFTSSLTTQTLQNLSAGFSFIF